MAAEEEQIGASGSPLPSQSDPLLILLTCEPV